MLYLAAKASVQEDSTTQVIETAPEMHLTPQDIDNLLDEVIEPYQTLDSSSYFFGCEVQHVAQTSRSDWRFIELG